MNKNLIIRADANPKIGTGHVMRCIALAQAWQDRGGNVTFLSHCESEALRQRIIDEGFDFIPIEKTHPDPHDLKQMLKQLETRNSKFETWLVLDGYHFTPDYQKAIRKMGCRLLVIDDMAHLDHYNADILLNQNIHASSLRYSCDRDAMKLLGCEYFLLRREFLKYKDWKREIPDKAKKILVTMGGSDPDNVTLKVIKALNSLNDPNLEVKIVVGPVNPNISSLEKELHHSPFSFHLLSSPSNMPALMTWADIAISAGGSTCWELAFMGLPSIVMILAENQKSVADEIAKTGMALNLGWYNLVDQSLISQTINQIILSKDKRTNIAEIGQILIDGLGTNRLIKKLNAISISIRPVSALDCELIWKWVNDSLVRSSAFRTEFIPFVEHKEWFYSKLQSVQCFQFIGYNDKNQPIGQIRFDTVRTGEVEVDVSVADDFRGKEYGVQLIKKGINELLKVSNVKIVHSFIKQNNHASESTFIKAGFVFKSSEIIQGHKSLHLTWKRQ